MPAMNAGGPVIAAPVPIIPAVIANPSAGAAVTMDPFSGPKGSPLDAMAYPAGTYMPVPANKVADPNNVSTGALSTGIGFGLNAGVSGAIDGSAGIDPRVGQNQLPARTGNFGANYQPGLTDTAGSAAANATFLAIGGGRSTLTAGAGSDWSKATSAPNPYTPAPICAFGNGGSRDAGAGPAFTGFGMKLLAAAADVADGAVVATGFVNRQGVVLNGTTDANSGWYGLVPLWQFASATAASVAPTMAEGEPPARSATGPGTPPGFKAPKDEELKKEFDEGLKKELEKKADQPTHKK